jgi:putative membrane protein insertion efficiency factor
MVKNIILWLIRMYQKTLSKRIGQSCRFTPSCSNYTIQAIELNGVFYGVIQGIKRIWRCRPPYGGEEDYPVKK